MSRVRVCFVVSCVYLISQILNKELWTHCMAGPFGGARHHIPLSRIDICLLSYEYPWWTESALRHCMIL